MRATLGNARRLNVVLDPIWSSPVVNILVVVALIVASVSVTSGNSPRAYPQNPELAWPTAFSGKMVSGEWTDRSFDATGVQITISLPRSWAVNSPATPERFNAIDRTNGLSLEIANTTPAAFALDKPVTAAQLAGSIGTMQAASPAGYVIEKAGQVRVGDRLWLWHESKIPAFDATNAPAYKDRLNEFPYGSSRHWSFASTPGSQLVRLYFTVMIPKGASEAQIASRTAGAGAIFAEIVRRISFARRSHADGSGRQRNTAVPGEITGASPAGTARAETPDRERLIDPRISPSTCVSFALPASAAITDSEQ